MKEKSYETLLGIYEGYCHMVNTLTGFNDTTIDRAIRTAERKKDGRHTKATHKFTA